MSFVTLSYIIFLPLALLGYYIVPHKGRAVFLLVMSLIFYGWTSVPSLLILLLQVVLSYGAGIAIGGAAKHKKLLTFASIALQFSVLVLFRVCGIVFDSVIIPVGISFYTFQSVSYVLDVYHGKVDVEQNIFLYTLYISFFPQLVAGPIERFSSIRPQLTERHDIDWPQMLGGMYLILWGYFKKLCIADYFSSFVDALYGRGAAPVFEADVCGPSVVLATVLFAFQIYCDFSGYCDIALGSARLFGIRLGDNFDRPYLSCSPRDFWRRWHISLTRWFTDYVYIPLGGSRRGVLRRMLNTMIVFLLSGIWHGLDLSFVLWGAIHGGALCIQSLVPSRPSSGVRRQYSIVFTFLFVCFTWIFFRSSSASQAIYLIGRIPFLWSQAAHGAFFVQLGMGCGDVLRAAVLVCLLYFVPKLNRAYAKCSAAFFMLLLIVFTLCSSMQNGVVNQFIYFAF